jgi:hypothetical protein
MIPFPPYEPDKGPFSATSTDGGQNILPISNGWGPMTDLVETGDSLGAQCFGAWWVRDTSGDFSFYAATKTKIYKRNGAGGWDHASRLSADQTTNGTFAADTNWTKGTNVTIAAGVATWTASPNAAGIEQAQSFTAGTIYKVTFTVSGYTAGGVRPSLEGGTAVTGTTRSANGTYTEYLTAVTGNITFAIRGIGASTTLNVDNVTVQALANYTGPADGELWQAERFGTYFLLTNINDPVQFIDVDTGSVFANLAGSPPQAKYIECVGDFLFLSYLKVGADEFPQDWQHSKINDAENWTITGTPGDSDRQNIPDGDEIVALFSRPGGARIIQRRCKRNLIFTPGSDFSFQMNDIDATRGAVAPLAVVPIGGDVYFYLNETGFYINDSHTPIGAERVDKTFFADIDLDKLSEVQGVADPASKIVWVTYTDQSGARVQIGWNWQLDRWIPPVVLGLAPYLLVSAVSVGAVLDDLDVYGTLDDITIPLDSRFWKGGRITFGAFTSNNKLAFFAGTPSAAIAETATHELTPDTGSYVDGAKLKSDAGDYTIELGYADLPDTALTWTAPSSRDTRTGMCSFHNDAKFHRFRANITEDTEWKHLHGCTPFFQESGFG